DEPEVAPGIGALEGFDPYDANDWPQVAGVYVFYDISDRPVYVGKSDGNMAERIRDHEEKFWFKRPIVQYGEFLAIADATLCGQLEVVLIKFLKSNAVLNK